MNIAEQLPDLQAALRALWPDRPVVYFTESSGQAMGPGPVLTDEERQQLSRVAEAITEARQQGARVSREERDDWQRDYEYLRDTVIERLNPRDDDIGEPALMVEVIETAARYIEAQPCSCPPDAGPPEWETPCDRCQALGRARDERIDR